MDKSTYKIYYNILRDIKKRIKEIELNEIQEVKDVLISLSLYNLIMIDNDYLILNDLFESVENKIKKLIIIIKEYLNKIHDYKFNMMLSTIQKSIKLDKFNLSLILIGFNIDNSFIQNDYNSFKLPPEFEIITRFKITSNYKYSFNQLIEAKLKLIKHT